MSIQQNKNLNYSAEPSRWNEYPNNFYLFYIQFIGGLQSGIIPTFVILKKMNIKEMMYEIYEWKLEILNRRPNPLISKK